MAQEEQHFLKLSSSNKNKIQTFLCNQFTTVKHFFSVSQGKVISYCTLYIHYSLESQNVTKIQS